MNTKEKRGKAIIGIVMAAIMLTSVFVAMLPMGSAVSKGDNFNYIGAVAVTEKVLVGQNVQFNTTAPNNWTDPGNVKVQKFEDGVWYDYSGPWSGGTVYNVDWSPDLTLRATNGTYNVSISVQYPNIPLTLKVGTKGVTTIAVGTPLRIDTGGINLFDQDRVDLEIIGPDGKIISKNNQYFTNITVANLKNFGHATDTSCQINTTGWKIGSYTFQIKTKSEYAGGLDAESAVKSLSIIKGEIDIKAEKTSAAELETIKLTVTGIANRKIWVGAYPSSSHVIFPVGINDNNNTVETDHFNHTIDADGTRTYSVKFNETDSYTIKVIDWGADGILGNADDTDDTVDITVLEKGVTFDLPATVVVGEKITIKGTANTGTYVDIFVDDELYAKLNDLVIDENGEFREEVTTTEVGMNVPGSVRLKAWIDCDKNPGDEPPATAADGDTAILLTRPGWTVELSPTVVALEDYFTVSGIAKGSMSVEILCVPPEGGGGKSLLDSGKTGLSPRTASVSTVDGKFEKKLTVQEDATTGYYDIYVLSAGMDGNWGMTGTGTLYGVAGCALDIKYGIIDIEDGDIGTKTQEDIRNILLDLTHSAGADDLLWVDRLKVEVAHVTLNPIASVAVGEPLVVTGMSNRREGYALVVTVKGPVELTPQTVKVENGTFNATFDTTGATVGTYTVKVDDGDGHTDEATVELLSAIFNTGSGTYPSIFGTHSGTIMPFYNINVSKMYTYSCPGTGGHTEYVSFYNATTREEIANGSWNGYQGAGDYNYIEFDSPFILQAKVTYNYTIRTGSYPQIIHEPGKEVTGGVINCTEFTDANGKTYTNWIPAIRLE